MKPKSEYVLISLRCITKVKHSIKKQENFVTDKRILHCYAISIHQYYSECRRICPQMERRHQELDMWFYRRMAKITWAENVSNDEVLKKMEKKDRIRKSYWMRNEE